jgi:hypothetical protein
LPASLTPARIWGVIASGYIVDASPTATWAIPTITSNGPSQPMIPLTTVATGDTKLTPLASTTPMTWTTSDELVCSATIEVA